MEAKAETREKVKRYRTMKKTKPELIERAFNFSQLEARADENEETSGIIEGRAVVYNSKTDLGWFYEEIAAGALAETDLTDVRFLVNHDLNKIPLARSRNNNANSTMQLLADAEGLFIRAKVDTENNADARALYSAIQRGDISGMSFMFSIDDEEWLDIQSEKPTRIIKRIASIVECSAVTFPAYGATSIFARNAEQLESCKRALESARAERGQDRAPEGAKKSELSKEIRMLVKRYK